MIKTKKDIKILIVVLLSALIYALNVEIFVEGASLYPGGFSGISMLISRVLETFLNFNLPFGYIYILLNITVSIMVYKSVGRKFMLFSIIHFIATSLFTILLPSIPITNDILLVSVFGGIFNGIAISMALRVNASSGGTDFVAIYISNKYRIQTWNYVMYFNAVILVIAGLIFGFDKSLYSIIFQFCSTQVVSSFHKRYKLSQLIIITDKAEEVSKVILNNFRHGITRLDGEGVYSHTPKSVLIITCGAFQVSDIVRHAKKADDHIFVTINNVEKVIGNYYQLPLE